MTTKTTTTERVELLRAGAERDEPGMLLLSTQEVATLQRLAALRGETEAETVAAILRSTLEALAHVR